jgi:hypothetical protein
MAADLAQQKSAPQVAEGTSPESYTAYRAPDETSAPAHAELPTPPGHNRFGHDHKAINEMAAKLAAQKGEAKEAEPEKIGNFRPPKIGKDGVVEPTIKPKPASAEPKAPLSLTLESDEDSFHEYMGKLHESNYDRYESLLHLMVDSNREYVAARLGLGWPSGVSYEELMYVPEELRETVKNLDPALWGELAYLPAQQRDAILQGAAQLEQQQAERQQAEQRQYEETHQRLQYEAAETINTLSSEFEKKHRDSLAAWAPFDDEKQNDRMRQHLIHGALMEISQIPEMAAKQREALEHLQEIPYLRMTGDKASADLVETACRRLAKEWNAKLGQIIRQNKELLEGEFADAKRWRESQKIDSKKPEMMKGGAVTAEYVDWLVEKNRATKAEAEAQAATPQQPPKPRISGGRAPELPPRNETQAYKRAMDRSLRHSMRR